MYICVAVSSFGRDFVLRFLCSFIYFYVLFRIFVYFIDFCIFEFSSCWCYGSFTHNEDIVRFRYGDGEPCSAHTFWKKI